MPAVCFDINLIAYIIDCVDGTTGIKPGETKDNVYMPINLSGGGIHPSTQGRYLKCEYHVCINCDISWASDVELNLHVCTCCQFEMPCLDNYAHSV